MNVNDVLQDVQRFKELCDVASQALSKVQNNKIFLIVAKDVGEPQVFEFTSIEDCVSKINELQAYQLENPDIPIYLFVFEGVRWDLVVHPAKGLKCGDTFIPTKLSVGDNVSVTSNLSLFVSK